ncbi:D-alanyl-D-alanine carboxypeptidase family protein [Streptomyces sp. S186]|uniref:D-alanyl-D-alanine carboxypeptidase family protein n=1 Tax=Streptomyces sp. S186 TaxID=3434395 RepID=UPI003F67182C
MPTATWSPVRALTAAAVCATSLPALACPAVADGPNGIDDLRGAPPAPLRHLLDEPGVQFLPRPGVPEPPRVSALSWAVTDLGNHRILAARDAHRQLPPASTLKTLFALTVLPRFAQGTVRTVSGADLAGIEAGSALAGLREDLRYRVGDLWRGVFLSSGSDAVRALATMNGGWHKTIEDMQVTARRMGARDTLVESADGFDTPGQFSSAYDLSLFGQAGLADRDFARLAATKTALLPEDGGPDASGIQNTNRLLVGSHGVAPYRGLIGVKNGYTSHAGNTLIAAARRGDRTLLVTVMHPRSGAENAVYEEARALLDWGFAAAPRAAAVGALPASSPDGYDAGTEPAAHRPPATAPHRAPAAGPAGRTGDVVVWSFCAAGVVALAGLGTALWWRRRRPAGPWDGGPVS